MGEGYPHKLCPFCFEMKPADTFSEHTKERCPERGYFAKRFAEAQREVAQRRAELNAAAASVEGLQQECPHVNSYRTSHQGESCTHCPDCQACGL